MKLILEGVVELWQGLFHLAFAAIFIIAALIVGLAPIWAPLSVIYWSGLDGWTAMGVFAVGGTSILTLLFAAERRVRGRSDR